MLVEYLKVFINGIEWYKKGVISNMWNLAKLEKKSLCIEKYKEIGL